MQTDKARALTAFEQLEKDYITFVIYHTPKLEVAVTYFRFKLEALRRRRAKYRIPDPPPHHFEGPVMSQEEMVAQFYASRAASSSPPVSLEELVQQLKVTLTLPDGPCIMAKLVEG